MLVLLLANNTDKEERRMSTTMDQIHHIRDLFYVQGKNISEIASETGFNWKTVKKYVDMDDFNNPLPTPKEKVVHISKLDPYKPLIDSWLVADKTAPRKQRHTATRVYRRLKKEAVGFDAGYRLVATYVAEKKAELRLKKPEGFLPLIHQPGESQADFGTADFYENGKHYKKSKHFVLSFPYSNGGYLQLCYGENMECLLESLRAIFEYIGGVPTEIWFDNTRTIVTDIIKGGGRNVTERFQRFAKHYRFRPVFMNPDAGHEKGNVENKVGYLRRNELVPVPRFPSLAEENKSLLGRCDEDMQREHYDDSNGRFISDFFEEDRKALIPLPAIPFDTCCYTAAVTNKYGKFTLDKGKHRYSASPAFPDTTVNIKLTASQVTVLDDNMNEIVTHRRLYGDETESMDWLPYLSYIARRPRSLRNTGIYEMMPEPLQQFMDTCENSERGKILRVLTELTRRSGFESAVHTVNEAARYQARDSESLMTLYNRLYAEVPLLPLLSADSGIPKQKVIPFRNDLTRFDAVLAKGGASRA